MTDGVGYESDRAVLVVTVVRPKVIEVPRLGSEISFVVKRDGGVGEELGGALRTSSISGDSRDGSITVEAGAVKPGGVLREQRTTSWTGKALGEIVGAIAERSGLVPAVSAALVDIVPMGPIQEGESDRQFLGRLLDRENAKMNIKDGRLIALAEGEKGASVSGATLPVTVVDLRGEAWVRWRRADSAVKGTVVARYIAEDGATVAMVKAGRGFVQRPLGGTTNLAAGLAARAAFDGGMPAASGAQAGGAPGLVALAAAFAADAAPGLHLPAAVELPLGAGLRVARPLARPARLGARLAHRGPLHNVRMAMERL